MEQKHSCKPKKKEEEQQQQNRWCRCKGAAAIEEEKGKETAANVKQDSTDDGQLQGVVIGVRVQHTETRTEAGVDGDGDGAVSLTVTAENAEPATNMDRLE